MAAVVSAMGAAVEKAKRHVAGAKRRHRVVAAEAEAAAAVTSLQQAGAEAEKTLCKVLHTDRVCATIRYLRVLVLFANVICPCSPRSSFTSPSSEVSASLSRRERRLRSANEVVLHR